MNKIVYISLLLSLNMVCSCSITADSGNHLRAPARINLETVDDLYGFLTYNEHRVPLISAHRGGPEHGYPENAIETFQHNVDRQPLIIECDIALTKDSALVLMHDDRLERTSSGKGFVNQHTLAELKQLKLKDNDGQLTTFHIPTLDEVLIWGRRKVIFTLDIKRGVPVAKVIKAVRRTDAAACVVIITYNATQAEQVHQLAPDLMVSASIRKIDDLLRLNDYGVPDNRLVAFVGVREPDSSLYKQLHEHGIMCILGTMGNLDKRAEKKGSTLYYQLVERGADILSTDRPIEAGTQLLRYNKEKQSRSPYLIP